MAIFWLWKWGFVGLPEVTAYFGGSVVLPFKRLDLNCVGSPVQRLGSIRKQSSLHCQLQRFKGIWCQQIGKSLKVPYGFILHDPEVFEGQQFRNCFIQKWIKEIAGWYSSGKLNGSNSTVRKKRWICFLKRLYLFIFRERGREWERETNIPVLEKQHSVASYAPPTGHRLTTQACAFSGNWTRHPTNWATPSRVWLCFMFDINQVPNPLTLCFFLLLGFILNLLKA